MRPARIACVPWECGQTAVFLARLDDVEFVDVRTALRDLMGRGASELEARVIQL